MLEIVRKTPAIMRDFCEVRLTTLRVNKSTDHHGGKEGSDLASFAVSCMPKGTGVGPKGAGRGGAADPKSASAKVE